MKTILYTFLLASITQTGLAQNWKSDPDHSRLGFTATHMLISEVKGIFKDFEIEVSSNDPNFSDAEIELTAAINSIDTEVEARDKHLKSKDFFDAENYPTMNFKSTSIKKINKSKYNITGDLTLHNIKKQVTVVMQYNGTTDNPVTNKKTAGFQITGTIKRSDFNIGSTVPNNLISDVVTIVADTELQFQ